MTENRPPTTRGIAALLLAAAMTTTACGESGDDATAATTTVPARTSSSVAAPAGGDEVQISATTTTTTVSQRRQSPATELALAWIQAVHDGDTETAWELTAEVERERIGSYDAFAAMRTELAEGLGAWADAEDRSTSDVLLLQGPSAAERVVTLSGTVSTEGFTQSDATALVVVLGEGEGVIFTTTGISWETEGTAGSTKVSATVPDSFEMIMAVDGVKVDADVVGVEFPDPHFRLSYSVPNADRPAVVTVAYETGDYSASADAILLS